jgi:hypothetical protein
MIRRDLFGGTDPDLDLHLSLPLATPWSNDDNLKYPIDINLSMISRPTPIPLHRLSNLHLHLQLRLQPTRRTIIIQ